MATVKLSVLVDYDEKMTNPDEVANAFDLMVAGALSSDGLLDDVGFVEVGFFEAPEDNDATAG